MRSFLRIVGLIGGIGLLVYGLFPQSFTPYPTPRADDAQWLLMLWGGAALLGLAAWASLPRLQAAGSRFNLRPGVLNVALVFSIMFVVLTIQLVRTSFIYAESVYNRTATDPQTGAVIGNSRPVIRSLRVRRGAIFDRNNLQLVDSAVASGGLTYRTYPVAQSYDIRAFSNILGFTSSRYGQYGLEASWNGYLTGEEGQPLRALTDQLYNRPQVGNNLQLTIDSRLQAQVWDILNRVGEGRPSSAVVMDPRSGAVLALVSTPGYDPQALTFNPDNDPAAENQRIEAAWTALNADESAPLINRPLQGRYVPGSTFKTLTAIGALENQEVLQEPHPIDCPNEYRPDPNAPPVVNAVGPPNYPDQPPLESIILSETGRPVDLSGVYAFSCNTAFAQLGVRLGTERLAELGERFHIYPPLNAPARSPDFTDLPTLASLLATEPGYLTSDAAVAATAYGQGQLFITPIQMALIGAAIANDGVMPQPYIVERAIDPTDPTVVVYQHRQPLDLLNTRRLMSSEVAAQMRGMMREAVVIGFGRAANVNNSGGKSGSGEAGGDIIHAAFLAIAPVDEPRYVVYVQIENGRDGAGVGAVAAGEILQAAFALE
jgi:peptidoglycan glycosyltransferase